MKTKIRYWQSVLQEAERELEAATGNITLKAAAKRYMRAKAEVRRPASPTTAPGPAVVGTPRPRASGGRRGRP